MRRLPLVRWSVAVVTMTLSLVALGVIGGLGSVGTSAAQAAPGKECARPLPATAIRNAAAVFTGVVESSVTAGTGFGSRIAVDRVYKGTLAQSTVQVSTASGACELGRLKADERYVVMVSIDGSRFVASGSSGTAVATDQLLGRVQALLGNGVAIGAETATEQVTFTTVEGSSPTPVLRAAAPGLALALVGALGWIAARRFA